jgi:hypothetical protein
LQNSAKSTLTQEGVVTVECLDLVALPIDENQARMAEAPNAALAKLHNPN